MNMYDYMKERQAKILDTGRMGSVAQRIINKLTNRQLNSRFLTQQHAAANRSDPYTADRVQSHMKGGFFSPSDVEGVTFSNENRLTTMQIAFQKAGFDVEPGRVIVPRKVLAT